MYDVTTVCVPVAAAKLAAYGDGSTASERRMSNMKTLSAFDVRDGFYFDGWYDESGDRVSDKLCCVVEMAKKSDSYMFARSVAKYSARFTYDDDYTIVMTASDKSAMRKVTGTLKRADLLGMSPFMSRMHMMQ